MISDQILSLIPQQAPFRFVDTIDDVGEEHILGTYQFDEKAWFYQGHFPNFPITPGVILIECMAQIGLVGLGISLLLREQMMEPVRPIFTSAEVEFLQPVYPGDRVQVRSDKIYYRFKKLKCMTIMRDESGKTLCKGTLSGMMVTKNDE
ncbi:MAG: 3-hydroxyacyl-ACP dehydratase FabZ family protein [Bacteroidota bacterium]